VSEVMSEVRQQQKKLKPERVIRKWYEGIVGTHHCSLCLALTTITKQISTKRKIVIKHALIMTVDV
jgi:hypothetical protein